MAESSAQDDGGEASDAGAGPECTSSTPLDWGLQVPEEDWNQEAGGLEQTASCTIIANGGDAMAGWELDLSCDVVDGMSSQPYEATFKMIESPFVALSLDRPIDLHYERWWGFEVTYGQRLSIAQDGEAKLVALGEWVGGSVGTCAQPGDTFRAEANAWLAIIDARVEPAECAEESVFRLARTVDGSDVHLYPGEIGDVGDDLRALVGWAACIVDQGESWDVRLVVWAS